MSTITPQTLQLGAGIFQVVWANLGSGDDGEPVVTAQFSDRTIQADGDSTSVTVEGSNDGTNFVAVNDPSGTPIDLDASNSEMAMIRENPLVIRPVASGGTDTTVTLIGYTAR